jgi:hypothetical protein
MWLAKVRFFAMKITPHFRTLFSGRDQLEKRTRQGQIQGSFDYAQGQDDDKFGLGRRRESVRMTASCLDDDRGKAEGE